MEIIEMFGCVWTVERYEVCETLLKEYDLLNKNRMRITCIKGNGFITEGEVRDFADTRR